MNSMDDDSILLILGNLHLWKMRINFAKSHRRGRRLVKQLLGVDLKLNEQQVNAFLDVMNGENVVIAGGAGVGKSHLLSVLRKHLPQRGLSVTAATGCAAAIIGGSTFHSNLALGLGKPAANIIVQKIVGRRETYQRIRQMETIIIDEAFALSKFLFDKAGEVVAGVRRFRPGSSSYFTQSLHFDTVQVVLVGDPLQLAPVGVETEGWIFNSKAWETLQLKTHTLTTIMRQQGDVQFAEILGRMRLGEATKEDLDYLKANSAPEKPEGALELFAVNYLADAVNRDSLQALEGQFHVFNALDNHAHDPNVQPKVLDELLSHCQAPKQLVLKVGARVVCLKNISDVVVNGSIGTVSAIDVFKIEDTVHHVNVTVVFDPHLDEEPVKHTFKTHIPGAENLDNVFEVAGNDNKTIARRIQMPLRLGFAISIHKSQGQSLDKVSIDFSRTFAQSQAYVALSRAKLLSKVYFTGLTLSMMKMVDAKALAFTKSLL